MIAIFDVETTGMYNLKRPVSDPCQPHIVSLAAMACSDDGKHEVGQYQSLHRTRKHGGRP